VKRLWLYGVLVLLTTCLSLPGNDFHDEVMRYFDQRLLELTEPGVFEAFIAKHPNYFPPKSDAHPVHVVVEKEHTRIGGKKVGLGVSYLQVFIAAEPAYVRQLMESPQWYRHIYDLDRDATYGPINGDGTFKAHIYKKVPVIPNQDYILSFSCVSRGDLWFQRATAIEDRKAFALRDNLKIVHPVEGGTLFREVSFVYPLSWWARALSGVARKTMIKELRIMGNAIKCIAEKGSPFDAEFAAACWRRFK